MAVKDASPHDVAPWGTATECTDDFGTKVIGVVRQRRGLSGTGDGQGARNGHEQR
jgi:hypothetical protein